MATGGAENIIDIGVPGSAEPEPHAVRPGRVRWRLWLAAACAGAVLAGASASAPPAGPAAWQRVTMLPKAPGAAGNVFIDDLLISRDPAGAGVLAYELAGGRMRWRADLHLAGLLAGDTVAGVLLLTGRRADDSSWTFSLDPGTGAVRWQEAGHLIAVEPARGWAILAQDLATTVRAVDPIGGSERWRHHLGDGAVVQPGLAPGVFTSWRFDQGLPRTTSLLISRPTGEAALLQFDSGSVSELGRLPVGGMALALSDGILIVDLNPPDGFGTGPSALAAFELPGLRPLWRADPGRPLENFVLSPNGTFLACADFLCKMGSPPAMALEPRTGRIVWWAEFSPIGYWPRRGGDLLIALRGNTSYSLVDPATGVASARFGNWRPIGPLGDELVAVLPGETGPGADRRVWLGLISGTGQPVVRLVGLLGPGGDALGDCRMVTRFLVCEAVGQFHAIDLAGVPLPARF